MILAQSYHCIGIGTDGTCTGTDDTSMRFDGTGTAALVLKVLTALALMLMIVAQSYLIFTDGF